MSNKKWTYEKCKEAALKHSSRTAFQKNDKGAYKFALKNNFLNKICGHMKELKRPPNYWSYKNCKNAALECLSRSDFEKKYKGAYNVSNKKKWIDKICSHMVKIGTIFNRCIYAFEFSDNSVYVGLTYNINKRKEYHFTKNKSQVYKHIKKTGLQPKLKQLTDYIDKNLASIKEGEFVKQYSKNGWSILNKAKTGALGGNISKWTYEKCKEEALKYDSKSRFEKMNKGAYQAACRNKWINKIYHFKNKIKTKGYWTKERCHKEALKYKSKWEFQKKCRGAYNASKINGWYNDICSHMIALQKPKGYWDNKNNCEKEALKYKSKLEFQKNSKVAYIKSLKNDWIDEICSHMKKNKKS